MAFTHTTRHGTAYYLHTGPKKGGGIQHYLSTDEKGSLANQIPEGFEVYCHVRRIDYIYVDTIRSFSL